MTIVEQIQEDYKVGQPIVNEFFKMSDAQIKEKIMSICGSKLKENRIENLEGFHVKRTIYNEEPKNIELNFYDSITISFMGIFYESEHGTVKEQLVQFNTHFTL